MSIVALEHPSDLSGSSLPDEEDPSPDQLGQYSVCDPGLAWQAAEVLTQRCVHANRAIPSPIVHALKIRNDHYDAIAMANAVLAITDIEERRRVICQMVHEIVRLK